MTGASSGIGAEVTRRLALAGTQVVMLARDTDRMRAIADRYDSPQPAVIVTDLRDVKSVNRAFEEIDKKFSRIDLLCTAAGIFHEATHIAQQSDEVWSDIIETNLTGVMRCIRAAWPLLSEDAAIVTIGSVLGAMSQPGVGAYAASKAALAALTRTVASEGANRGIRANMLVPGMVRTPMNQRMADASGNPDEWWRSRLTAVPLGRAAEPAEIAEMVCWLVGEHGKFITGTEICLDGGILLRSGEMRSTGES